MVVAGTAERPGAFGVGIGFGMGWFRGNALDFPGFLRLWAERRRMRRALARMDEHLLKDIGLTPGEAENEIQKPFWRA